jgi:hypothetical protein
VIELSANDISVLVEIRRQASIITPHRQLALTLQADDLELRYGDVEDLEEILLSKRPNGSDNKKHCTRYGLDCDAETIR